MQTNDINDVFSTLLCDVYDAENQLKDALPEMAQNACNPDLAAGFQKHLKETEQQAERLDKVFEMMNIKQKNHTCDAMEGLLHEAATMMKGAEKGPVRDAGMVALAKKIEHYEIASYETLIAMAEAMGAHDAANQFRINLSEERTASEKLDELARRDVNPDAFRQAA